MGHLPWVGCVAAGEAEALHPSECLPEVRLVNCGKGEALCQLASSLSCGVLGPLGVRAGDPSLGSHTLLLCCSKHFPPSRTRLVAPDPSLCFFPGFGGRSLGHPHTPCPPLRSGANRSRLALELGFSPGAGVIVFISTLPGPQAAGGPVPYTGSDLFPLSRPLLGVPQLQHGVCGAPGWGQDARVGQTLSVPWASSPAAEGLYAALHRSDLGDRVTSDTQGGVCCRAAWG